MRHAPHRILAGRAGLPLLLAAALLAGCSAATDPSATTEGAAPDALAQAGETAAGDAAGGAAVTTSPPVGSEAGSGADSSSVAGGSASGPGGAASAGEPAAAAPPGGAAGAGSAGGPATGGTIKIGFVILDVAGLQSVNGVKVGDNRVQAQAVVDHVNATGGLAGRKIVPVYAKFSAASSNWERDYQAICTDLTEDEKVFAVVTATIAGSKTFASCLAAHGTPLINSAGGTQDRQSSAALGRFFYTPGSFDLTRLARAYVDGLAAAGFFSRTSKVGLIRVDDAPYARVTRDVVRPRLQELGVRLEEEAAVAAQESISTTTSQMPNLVLRFQQKGIDRVLVLDNGTLAISFSLQAASQNYRPRYGLNSLNNPVLMQQNAPAESLRDAVGVGWQPTGDVDAQRDPHLNKPARVCNDINVRAGQGDVDRTGVWQQRMYCDGVFFLQASLAGRAPSADAVLAGSSALGRSFESAITFGTDFSGGRRDGASVIRTFAYDQTCSCFRYQNGSRPAL